MEYTYTGTRTVILTKTKERPFALKAVPGETYDLDADPCDPRFSAVQAPAATSTTPVEPPAVSGGETPSSPPESLTVSEPE